MPLGSMLNSFLLLARNLDSQKTTKIPVEKGKPDKPICFTKEDKINFLDRCRPSEVGIKDEYIQSFINEINSDFSLKPNRLMIIKSNKVIGEQYLYPNVQDAWDSVFSASKTVTALALGVLYDEGLVDLDLPVCKILKNEKTIKVAKNKRITLRHLLTMSTGIRFNEIECVSSTRWTKSFFDSSSKFKLGTKFDYNSLNSYIVARVVQKLSGSRFEDFIKEKIFDPIGISKVHIDTSEEDCFKGGWGLYILPEDMARLGILVRDYGMYEGKQIISKEWINMMSTTQFDSRACGRDYNYGFQMWVDDELGFSAFNGLYDQNIMVYRHSGVVIVTCFADNEAFHGSNLFKIATKYFGYEPKYDFPLCENNGKRDLENEESLMYYFDALLDKEYKTHSKIANSCGILPLIIQNEVSTYVKGIRSLMFKKIDNQPILIINEGGKKYEIPFSFGNAVRQLLTFYNNVYDCAVDARLILSGKTEPYMIIRFFFLEFASARYFTVKLGKDINQISVECSENPGVDFVNSLIQVQDEGTKKLINSAMTNLNQDYITGKIRNIFAPIFIAKATTAVIKKEK